MLVDLLEHPTCPLVELPQETLQRHQHCRLQLWKGIVRGTQYIPITSYLAYTQRTNVNICLLSWMVANPQTICQRVPHRMIKSVRLANCLFSNSENQFCEEVNSTEAICFLSRALLLLKCSNFYSNTSQKLCSVPVSSSFTSSYNKYLQHTKRKINFRGSLNSNTLKYKDFRINNLKALETSFIAVNVFFRFLTVMVYLLLSQLRNLPGIILLCYQVTGIIQIICSEAIYRMAGIPDLPTIVQVDSSLTLLCCMWLNAFCYQMYACIRHLRLPDDLLPLEVNQVFRAQLFYVMMPWAVLTAACVTLERTNEEYLLYSRVVFLTGVILSVAINLVLLGFVGYMWLHTHCNLQTLQVSSSSNGLSKQQVMFMSVKAMILSGVGVIIRVGFHQAQGIAQVVYIVHVATMSLGPLMFILFACNGTVLPLLRARMLAWWNPNVTQPGQEFCSSAERNMRRQSAHIVETSV